MSTTVTFHPLHALPAPLIDFWERQLREQDEAGYLSGCLPWIQLMAGENPDDSLVVHAEDEDGFELVLPLLARTWSMDATVLGVRFAGITLPVWKVGGGDLIVRGAQAAKLADVWRVILAKDPSRHGIWFDHIAAGDRFASLVQAGGGTFALTLFRDLPHYRFALPETRDDCMALRSAKSLSRIRSKANALERQVGQACRVVELRTVDELEPYADRIDDLMNQSWQARLLGQQFRLENFRGSALAGWLRVFVLLGGEQAIACTLYYCGKGSLISGVLGYDQAFAKHSPGAILFQRTLEMLYAGDPPRFLDFGEGDADYKRQWANHEIHVSAVMLLRSGISLRLRFAGLRVIRALDAAMRSLLRVTGLDRWLVRRLKQRSR